MLEHADDAVELAAERAVVAVDPVVDLGQLALQALGLRRGAHPLAQIRIELDRMDPWSRTVARRRPPAWRSDVLASRLATSRRYWRSFGWNVPGRRTLPSGSTGPITSSAVTSSDSASSEITVRRIPALRDALATITAGPR